nr:hypothetical protein [Rhodobacter sp.]
MKIAHLPVVFAALLAPGVSSAATDLACRFETMCTGIQPCVAADTDTVIGLKIAATEAKVSIDGDRDVTFQRVGDASVDPQTFF